MSRTPLQARYSLTSVLHTSLGENAQVRYSEVCVISEKDQMMKTKHGGTKFVRYSEGNTIVHVCDTEVKLYYVVNSVITHRGECNNQKSLVPKNPNGDPLNLIDPGVFAN